MPDVETLIGQKLRLMMMMSRLWTRKSLSTPDSTRGANTSFEEDQITKSMGCTLTSTLHPMLAQGGGGIGFVSAALPSLQMRLGMQ